MLAVCVLIQAIFTADIRNGTTGSGADTYRNDQQLAFPGFPCYFNGGIDRVLAIAEDDQGVCAALRGAAFEILHGLAQNKAEIGTTHPGPGAVHLFQRIAQGCVVISKRYHQVCLAGKDDKANFITRQGINQFKGCGAGFCKARGFYVLGFHGA